MDLIAVYADLGIELKSLDKMDVPMSWEGGARTLLFNYREAMPQGFFFPLSRFYEELDSARCSHRLNNLEFALYAYLNLFGLVLGNAFEMGKDAKRFNLLVLHSELADLYIDIDDTDRAMAHRETAMSGLEDSFLSEPGHWDIYELLLQNYTGLSVYYQKMGYLEKKEALDTALSRLDEMDADEYCFLDDGIKHPSKRSSDKGDGLQGSVTLVEEKISSIIRHIADIWRENISPTQTK